MKKFMVLILTLVVTYLFVINITPHTSISFNFNDVNRIDIICGKDITTIEDSEDIEYLSKKISKIHLYPSDIETLQSSPEKFIKIYMGDENYIAISNIGIYSLVTHEAKENDVLRITNGEVFMTNYFSINYIALLAKMATAV